MGRDRKHKERENSKEHEVYDEELNFTVENDDLFKEAEEDAETVDFEDSQPGKTPVSKLKEESKKTKGELSKIMQEFDNNKEELHDKYVEAPDFEEDNLEMEKVNLEQLNEEEKFIERSRIKEQK